MTIETAKCIIVACAFLVPLSEAKIMPSRKDFRIAYSDANKPLIPGDDCYVLLNRHTDAVIAVGFRTYREALLYIEHYLAPPS